MAKVLELQLSTSPSNEYSGLISFRIGWFDLAVQETLKSLLQQWSLKASVLWHSAFSVAHPSHPCMTAGKTIALTMWASFSKVMSLLFNTLSGFVIAILPRSKCLLVLWLQSPSSLILEPKTMKLILFPHFPHLFARKWWDPMPWSSFFECWVLSQLFSLLFHLPQEAL